MFVIFCGSSRPAQQRLLQPQGVLLLWDDLQKRGAWESEVKIVKVEEVKLRKLRIWNLCKSLCKSQWTWFQIVCPVFLGFSFWEAAWWLSLSTTDGSAGVIAEKFKWSSEICSAIKKEMLSFYSDRFTTRAKSNETNDKVALCGHKLVMLGAPFSQLSSAGLLFDLLGSWEVPQHKNVALQFGIELSLQHRLRWEAKNSSLDQVPMIEANPSLRLGLHMTQIWHRLELSEMSGIVLFTCHAEGPRLTTFEPLRRSGYKRWLQRLWDLRKALVAAFLWRISKVEARCVPIQRQSLAKLSVWQCPKPWLQHFSGWLWCAWA